MSNTVPHATQYEITLISHKLCPYVQRAVIALQELGIDYQRIDIDLDNKPGWFNTLSPLGKVPVMVVDNETVLFESAAIAEYVNDIGGGQLLSSTSVDKARQRAWIEFASATLNNIGQLYSALDETQYKNMVQELNKKWSLVELNLSETGFFSGNNFSLVDAAFAPVFRYFEVFEQFTEFKFLNRHSKISSWRKKMAQRTSVIGAVSQDYPELLTSFVSIRNTYLGQLAKSYQHQKSQQRENSFQLYKNH